MATSATAPYPSYYQPYEEPETEERFGYENTKDPRKLAQNQRSVVQSTGDILQNRDRQLSEQYARQASGVENYLNPIESKLAAGEGGYSPDEVAQIEYSPEEAQNLVNKAGISAGQQTAASVGAAERAAAAVGGSPAALATYRARAAQTAGVNAGDAMTNARVAAKELQSSGAKTVGDARLGQQQVGLNYYGGLQQQKNANALSEQGLEQGAYGTQTSGTNAAVDTGLKASQTPTTADKIIGGISGAASAFLADGLPNYMDDGQDAVVGENGMEAVIDNAPEAVMDGASDPVRSHTTFMDDGFAGDGSQPGELGDTSGPSVNINGLPSDATMVKQRNQSQPNLLQQYLAKVRNQPQQPQSSQQEQWNKTTPYQQAGEAAGKGLSLLASHLADGDSGSPWWKDIATDEGESILHAAVPALFAKPKLFADGRRGAPSSDQGVSMQADGRNGMRVGRTTIFTKPTMVHLNKSDAVVPLTFRPKAKVRPSAALPAMQGR